MCIVQEEWIETIIHLRLGLSQYEAFESDQMKNHHFSYHENFGDLCISREGRSKPPTPRKMKFDYENVNDTFENQPGSEIIFQPSRFHHRR